ncbi:MAG: response regulator [Bacteroidales bacterium]|nr:response regulator [Bacteroidales bacterium]
MDKTILIVDDIFVNRRVLAKNLQNAGYYVLEAENGKEAIEKLTQNDVACVLMDIEMPVMNGIEAARYIRYKLPSSKARVKILAITAYNDSTINEYLEFSLFDGIVTKPFSFQQIEKILKDA